MRTFAVVVVALAVTLSSVSACTQYIKSCTKSDSLATNVDIYSEPPWETLSVGDTYTSYTTFTLKEQVTSGKDHQKATLSGITVKDETTNLCTDLSKTDIPCPLSIGEHTSKDTETIGSIPSGTLAGTIRWSTDDGREILCIESVMCI